MLATGARSFAEHDTDSEDFHKKGIIFIRKFRFSTFGFLFILFVSENCSTKYVNSRETSSS